MLFLLPIFIRIEGGISLDKKTAFIMISLYGIRMITLRLFLDKEQGLLISLNGRKGRAMSTEKKRGMPKKDYLPLLYSLFFTEVKVSLYVGGDVQGVSLILGAINVFSEQVIRLLTALRRIDNIKIRFLPCYVNDQGSVNFSIRLFTSIALILYGLAHTRKGDKNAKRINRKSDG